MSRSAPGYATVWTATLLFFASFYALLVPLPRYLAWIGFADWQIGVVLGAFGIASLICRPLTGIAVDRFGSRPVLLLGVCASLIGAVGVLLTTDFGALLVLRLLQAIGYVAFTTAGTALVVRLSPPEQRTRRIAIFGTAANIAITLTPAAISALLTALPLASAFVLAGALALLAGALTLRLPALPAEAVPTAAPAWQIPRVLWLLMLITGLFGAGFAAFFQFAPILAERRGDILAGWLYTAYGIAIIATRLLSRGLLDGRNPTVVLCAAACCVALGLGLIALGPPIPLLLLAVLLVAGASGVYHPLLIAQHAALLPHAAGRAMAAFYLAFDLGIGLGSWLGGISLQLAGLPGLYGAAAVLVLLVLALAPRRATHA